MMEQVVNFIKYLAAGSHVEINDLNHVISFKDGYGKSNIYFCAGLKEKKDKRCDDSDIGLKSYFFVDIDIRQNRYAKFSEILPQEKLNSIALDIIFKLELEGLGGFSAAVYSGNGLHLYYTGTPKSVKPNIYANGVEYFYRLVDESIADMEMCCDHACKNIARITRLPGSTNPRKKLKKGEVVRDLGPIDCEIMVFEPKDSEHFEKLEEYARLYEESIEQEKAATLSMKRDIKQNYQKPKDVWDEINKISIGELAEIVRGVRQGTDDGEVITLRESKKNMGAYVYKPFNIIYNQGSSLIRTDRKTFTSFELVCFELFDGDRNKTLQFFKDKYGIEIKKDQKQVIPDRQQYTQEGYLYPDAIFDDPFDCAMSGELVTIVAQSNSGKTTFAMDMLQRNIERGKKCFYINLEFGIDQVAIGNWLFMNGKRKRNLTDIDPLTQDEKTSLDEYVKKYLSRFDHYNNPGGISLDDLVAMLIEKRSEGYGLIVLDTFSRIHGNADDKAYTNQNICMETLQALCQNIGICLVMLHHTNKNGTMEGSQKILNLSNTLITMAVIEDDVTGFKYTKHMLTKDKFVSSKELLTEYINRRRVAYNP